MTKLIILAAISIFAGTAQGKDACSVLTKDEMSDLIGTKIAWAGPAAGRVPDGASACSYTSGQARGLPGALVEVSEAQGGALLANCRGAESANGLGDRACVQSNPFATILTAVKGKAGVMVTLFNSKLADPKSAARKIAQTVLDRL